MNIKVQCCGIVLITLLAIVYRRQRKLNLITGKVFQGCLFVALFCLSMDILSLAMIAHREKFSAFLLEFICKTYVVSLVLASLFAVIYIATSVSFHLRHYKKNIAGYIVLAVIISVLIYALPIYIHENADRTLAWSDGPSTYATYLGVLMFIIINFIQLFRYKEYIYERQRGTVLIWMVMWIAAACIQLFNKQLLVVGFACALGIMLIFFQFENPELNLDWKTGLFNYVAYTRYGEQLYSNDKNFYVVAVRYENAAWQTEGASIGSVGSQRMFDVYLKISDASAFKITENVVLLIFSNEKDAKSFWNKIIKWREKGKIDTVQGRPSFFYVEDARCVPSYRELLELIQYADLQKRDTKPGSFYIIERSTVPQMIAERKMVRQIVKALDEDRVIVHYQPIYSLKKKCFASAEALVRIIDREGNLIQPGEFIHIAEINGMINEIGRRVFEKVCRFIRQSRLEDYGIQYIDVNLSVVQCADDRLAEAYIDIMKDNNINPDLINLEITESASLHQKQLLLSNMERMIKHGLQFSLDDFGTGQSNLNYIVDMPVKIIKFDRDMIQSYFSSDKAKYVMDAAMQMIHGMGMGIVAEGIETAEQCRKMKEIDIDFIQGYYFSKPLPEQEFVEFLRLKNKLIS